MIIFNSASLSLHKMTKVYLFLHLPMLLKTNSIEESLRFLTCETFDHSAVTEWQNSTNEYLVTVCLSFFRIYRTPVFPESTSCILWPKNFISSVGSFISTKDIYIYEGYLYSTTSFMDTIYLCIQNIQISICARMQVIRQSFAPANKFYLPKIWTQIFSSPRFSPWTHLTSSFTRLDAFQ